MSIATLLAVGAGGALGALCRSKATAFLKPRFMGRFPLPTLLINLAACLTAGIALALQLRLNGTFYLALTMGFLGGFSTLSTMNFEAVELITQNTMQKALATLQPPMQAPSAPQQWALRWHTLWEHKKRGVLRPAAIHFPAS